MNLENFSVIKTLKELNITANKRLGQNFITDQNVTKKICQLAEINSDDNLIEIGCGLGSLTVNLIKNKPKSILLIEKDNRFANLFDGISGLNFVLQDALNFDYENYAKKYHKPLKIVANLPYNIASDLIWKWVRILPCFESLTLMVQKDFADKILLNKITHIGLILSTFGDIKRLFNVSPESFTPKPRVLSSVIQIKPSLKPEMYGFFDEFDDMLKLLFSNRRKPILKTLTQKDQKYSILADIIDPNMRPDKLNKDICVKMLHKALEDWKTRQILHH